MKNEKTYAGVNPETLKRDGMVRNWDREYHDGMCGKVSLTHTATGLTVDVHYNVYARINNEYIAEKVAWTQLACDLIPTIESDGSIRPLQYARKLEV